MICLIPARLDSQRFPEKLIKDLGGKPVIVRTWQSALSAGVFDRVVVVTDSSKLAEIIRNEGGETFISHKVHPSGTDRIAEAAREMNADVFVNIQGDEPFVSKEDMLRLKKKFEADKKREIDIISFCQPIKNKKEFTNPNNVKVVTDSLGKALYFSRAPIPYPRNGNFSQACKHIGIYAFRYDVLQQIARMPPSVLEKIEGLENLRFLENGLHIHILKTHFNYMGIDTPEDLEAARKLWKYES